jgi:hypothetical protein
MDDSGKLGLLGYRSGELATLPDIAASLATGTMTAAATGHRGAVTSLIVNAAGTQAASGGSDGAVRVWDTQTGRGELNLLPHPSGPIDVLAFSPDDRWLVSGSPGLVRVFALDRDEPASEIRTGGRPLSLSIDAASRSVAIGDSAGNIVLAALDGSTTPITLRGGSPITALDFGGTAGLLASGNAAGELALWDTRGVPAVSQTLRLPTAVSWVAFAGDDSSLIVRSGSWLHRLQRTQDAIAMVGSSVLPAQLRTTPALALTGNGEHLRLLAIQGGGRLALGELALPLAAGSQATPAPAAELPVRDWRRVLGLELDPERGSIRRIGL